MFEEWKISLNLSNSLIKKHNLFSPLTCVFILNFESKHSSKFMMLLSAISNFCWVWSVSNLKNLHSSLKDIFSNFPTLNSDLFYIEPGIRFLSPEFKLFVIVQFKCSSGTDWQDILSKPKVDIATFCRWSIFTFLWK